MRYIEKNNPCLEFDDYIIESGFKQYLEAYLLDKIDKEHPWKKIGSVNKRNLALHLYKEQKGLCAYCQQRLNPNEDNRLLDYAHNEHMKPKSLYPELTYSYENLVVSCDGFDNSQKLNKKEFCGHKKDNDYSEELFLDPTKIVDIDSYFTYTIEGEVKPSKRLTDDQKDKVTYMIRLLDLQNSILVGMRADSYSAFIENEEDIQFQLLDIDVDLLPGFYSMLVQLS